MIEQAHYSEWPLAMEETYGGRCSEMQPEEVAAMVLEGLRYFGLDDPLYLPPPPSGLIGAEKGYNRDAHVVARDGLYYVLSLLNRSPRAQWNAFCRIDGALKVQFNEGKKAAEREYSDIFSSEISATADNLINMRDRQVVYFIGSVDGPIKIGVALRPEVRLSGLQTASPDKLYLLATCEGGLTQEQAYHRKFADHRLEGEWFERHPNILSEIERLTNPPLNIGNETK